MKPKKNNNNNDNGSIVRTIGKLGNTFRPSIWRKEISRFSILKRK